jgi:hypothetical protein
VLAGLHLLGLEPGSTATTNTKTPTRLSWGFFLGDRAYCPVLLRVPAERCGPRSPHHLAGSVPGSLSSGYFSLRSSCPGTGRSPKEPLAEVNKINDLRVDESTCFLLNIGMCAGITTGSQVTCSPFEVESFVCLTSQGVH